MNYQTHKDRLPEETIKKVRNILSEIGLFPREIGWRCNAKKLYSVKLEDIGLKISTNGKGVSETFALASAYAEFLERVENEALIPNTIGLMSSPTINTDMVFVEFNTLMQNSKPIIEHLFTQPLKDSLDASCLSGKIACLPFYNVFDNKVENLPQFMRLAIATNGYCAGNTPEEALCQGICEIFERYAVKEVYGNKYNFPTIPLSEFQGLQIYEIINEFIEMEYNVIIKDCTLGGLIPVLGIILLHKESGRYAHAFGSDPLAEVALQRCFTESLQGEDIDRIREVGMRLDFSEEQFKNINFSSAEDKKIQEYITNFLHTSGELPNQFLFSNGEPRFREAFQGEFKSHDDSLKFLLHKIKKSCHSLYVRDNSFLGFPAYSVYIPGLSEATKITKQEFYAFESERQFVKKCLLNLKEAPTEDIHKCACLLAPLLDTPGQRYYTTRHNLVLQLTLRFMDNEADFCQFEHLALLLVLMFHRCKEYKKAFKYLSVYLKEEGHSLSNFGYYSGVLAYLKLKIAGASDTDINNNLGMLLGDERAKELIDDLGSPEEIFKYYTLPKCGNCSLCPAAEDCLFERWKTVALKINEKKSQNPIKQENLSALFDKYWKPC